MNKRIVGMRVVVLTFLILAPVSFTAKAQDHPVQQLSTPTTSVPCEIVDNLPYVQSKLNGSSNLWFVLDSGSSYTVVDSTKAQELGLRPSTSVKTAGGAKGGDNNAGIINDVTIETGPTKLADQTVVSLPFKYVAERVGHVTDGTLGSNVFLNYVVGINYVEKRVTFNNKAAWNPDGNGEMILILVESNVPFIQAKVSLANGQQVKGRFVLDLGQIMSGVLITESFQKAHPELLHDTLLVHPPSISAVGGSMKYSVGRIPQLEVGSFKISEPIAAFPEGAAGIYANPEVAGGIGADILSKFDIVFDYSRHQMFLKPNTNFDQAIAYDMSGLQLGVKASNFTQFIVTGITDPSPASKASILKGDIILAVNGIESTKLTLSEVQRLLRRTSEHCNLAIQRGEQTLSFDLRLSPML